MATDRRLSANFRLSEFSGWERATEAQVARLRDTVARVLQPLRSALGVTVYPSSWLEWSDGTPRTGSHAEGGTVDFVVSQGLTRDAWEWGKGALVPSGYVGRWIYEPARSATEGVEQGEHIHVAPVRDMREAFGPEKADIQVLEEESEGVYRLAFQAAAPVVGGLGLLVAVAWAVLAILARRPDPAVS